MSSKAANEKSVLSIQSHVTHGYVGNKAATFPLQLHGFDVDAINTVSLSNHSGYPVIKGHRMDLAEYQTILSGLRANHFLSEYRYILTGYINNRDIVANIEETVTEIRALRAATGLPPPTYICDPVMGDDGQLYCGADVIDAYRSILHVADIATPNYFEASVLSGIEVVDMATATRAADWFHAQGTPCVVIKSFQIPGDDSRLHFLLSVADRKKTRREEEEDDDTAAAAAAPRRFVGTVPHCKGRYTGTGDVFAASLLAFSHASSIDVAVAKAMGVVHDLILATMELGGVSDASLDSRELRVTKSPESLLRPKTVVEIHLAVAE